MIANCPSCGTHFKHEPLVVPTQGRCGRCDASVVLSRLKPYRIVPVEMPRSEDVARAARHLPIGLDDPVLASTIARNVDRRELRESPSTRTRHAALPQAGRPGAPVPPVPVPPVPGNDAWEGDDPLPPIPEMMTGRGEFEPSVPPVSEEDILAERVVVRERDVDETIAPDGSEDGGRGMSFVLWLAAGGIVGTGASWTLGGTTLAGIVAGVPVGALMGWGWVRWTSPK